MWTVKVAVLLAAHVFLTDGTPEITKTEFKKNTIIVEWTGESESKFEINITRDGVATSGEQKIFAAGNSYTIDRALQTKNYTITVFERSSPQSNDTVTFQTPTVIKTTVGSSLTVSWPLSTTEKNLMFGYRIENMDTSEIYIELEGSTSATSKYPSFSFNGDPKDLTTTTNITISNITTEFGGYVVSSFGAVIYGGIVLAVQGKPSKPSISGGGDVEEGKDTTLNCSSVPNTSPDYVSFPALTYRWLVDRSDALPARFIQNGSLLTITNVTRNDANRRITCRAFQNNTASDLSENFQLNVMYGPTTVILSPPSTTYTKYEGGTFGPISCTADCNPPCSIKWRFNASRGNGRFEDISTKASANNVSVTNISRNDTGAYRCIALTNISGSNKSARNDVHLDVQYGPDPPVIRVDNLYVRNNETIEKIENSTVKLDCSTESNPVSLMEWTRVRTKQKLPGSVMRNMVSSTLTNVSCEDTDAYKCSADNRVGVVTRRQFRLQIKCAPRIKDRFQQTYGVKINSTVSVVIPVQGFPKPQFSWIDNKGQGGSSVVTSSNESSYRHVVQSTLQIKTSTDFKNYTFRIQNNVGANVYTITVIAKDRPIPPRNLSFGDVQTDSVNLTWISGFNGGSEQRFLIEQINPSGKILVGNVSDPGQGKEVSFIVNNLLPKRRYTFQIISVNTQGDTRNTSQIIVVRTKELRIPSQASSVGAIAGASATVVVIIIALVVVFLVYSLRKKQIKKATDTPEQEVMYAAVNKPIKKKPQKAGPSGKQPDEDEGNLYANTADNAPLHYVSSNGANQKAEPVRTKNQDGLIYIDVEFQKPPKQGQGGPVIHGDESRTEYMQVDFNRRASPEAAEGDNSDE